MVYFCNPSVGNAVSVATVAVIGCILSAAAPAIAAAPSYQIINLGTLPNGAVSKGAAVNDVGQVTGFSNTNGGPGGGHAFLYQDGAMQDLGTLGGDYSYGQSITIDGVVAGYAQGTNSFAHAIMRDGFQMYDLGTLGGNNSYAYGINGERQVTGSSQTVGNQGEHAFLYDNGVMQDLGTLGPGNFSRGYAINGAGAVTGISSTNGQNVDNRAFLYSGGVMTDLGTLGGNGSTGRAINNYNQVAGFASVVGNVSHAFLYSDGAMLDLGTLGGHTSRAYALNDAGQVTGTSLTTGSVYHAFLYADGVMYDLNALIDPLSGWELVEATGINIHGQITGYGLFQGQTRAFLLSPGTDANEVPEPASWALMIAGFGLVGGAIRRQNKTQRAID